MVAGGEISMRHCEGSEALEATGGVDTSLHFMVNAYCTVYPVFAG